MNLNQEVNINANNFNFSANVRSENRQNNTQIVYGFFQLIFNLANMLVNIAYFFHNLFGIILSLPITLSNIGLQSLFGISQVIYVKKIYFK